MLRAETALMAPKVGMTVGNVGYIILVCLQSHVHII